MGRNPVANRWFVKLSKQFVLVSHDTKNGSTPLTKEFSLKRNKAYLLVFGVYQEEIERSELSWKQEFNEHLSGRYELLEQNYIQKFRKQLWEYIASYRQIDESLKSEVESLIQQLGHEEFRQRKSATRKLTELGDPAVILIERLIAQTSIHDTEIKTRIQRILSRNRSARVLVDRKGLDHDIAFLSKGVATVPAMKIRLENILPEGSSVDSANKWWKEHGQRYQWDAALQKYRLK